MRVVNDAEPARVHRLMQPWEIVKNPKRSALRGRNQLLLSLMNCEIGDGSDREIELHRLPVRAIIERNVHTRLSAGIEQTTLGRIFADYARERALSNAVGDLLPGLAIVTRLVEIGFVVVIF